MTNQDTLTLRPEAQPVRSWTSLSRAHQQAFRKLIEMLSEAVQGLKKPTPRIHRSLPWLYLETRSQIAFLDGLRGSGKTTLMSTLISAIDSVDTLPLNNGLSQQDLRLPESLTDYEYVTHQIRQTLHASVVCVQPLDMEPLPKGSSLLPAILVRIMRALKSPEAADFHDPYHEPNHEDRALIRLHQYTHRIVQALNSNLQNRSGQLDPDQYSMQVIQEEEARLQLPSDLDFVLRSLTDNTSNLRHTQHPPANQRLFLIPIDDVDLNPRQCLELLQLLRTFSPPPELFFLLMGQFDLVEKNVELKTATEYADLYSKAQSLSDTQLLSFQQDVRKTALLNLRKMIPPHARCQMAPYVDESDAFAFKPLTTSSISISSHHPIPTLSDLLRDIPVYALDGTQSRLKTALELFTGDRFFRPKSQPDLNGNSWTTYPGKGTLNTSLRMLTDLWITLYPLRVRQESPALSTPHRIRHSLQFRQTIHNFLKRIIDLDANLPNNDRERLADHRQYLCIESMTDAPRYAKDDVISSANITCGTNNYIPHLRFADLTDGSGIPFFELHKPTPPEGRNGKPHATDSATVAKQRSEHQPSTRCALTLQHDLHSFLEPDSTALPSFPELTSARPVRLTWVGNEGEVASFEWPIPPLPSYLETSHFLYLWQTCVDLYHTSTDAAHPDTPEVPPNPDWPATAAAQMLRGTPSSDLEPDVQQLVNYAALWIVTGTVTILKSQSHQPDDTLGPSLHILTKCIQSAQSSFYGSNTLKHSFIYDTLLPLVISKLLSVRESHHKTGKLREWRQIDKWLRRISRLIQPESLTVPGSKRFMSFLIGRSQEKEVLDAQNEVVGILRHQRSTRLIHLWQSGKRSLWRALNNPKEINSRLLIVAVEPTGRARGDIRIEVRKLQRELAQLTQTMRDQSTVDAMLHDLRSKMMLAAQVAERQDSSTWLKFLEGGKQLMKLLSLRPHAIEIIEEFITMSDRIAIPLIDDTQSFAAEEIYQWNLKLLLKEFESTPDSLRVRRQLSKIYCRLAEFEIYQGDFPSAWNHAKESLGIDKTHHDEHPLDPEIAEELGISLELCGRISLELRDWQVAMDYLNQAMVIARDFSEQDPDSSMWESFELENQQLLAQAFLGAQDRENAEIALKKVIETATKLRDSRTAAKPITDAYKWLADLYISAEDWPPAQMSLETAISSCQQAIDVDSNTEEYKEQLAQLYEKAALVAKSLGKLSDAEKYYHLQVDVLRFLARDRPDLYDRKDQLCLALTNLGDMLLERRALSQANLVFEEAVQLTREMRWLRLADEAIESDLGFLLSKHGHVFEQLEDWSSAYKSFNESLTIAREQSTNSPDNKEMTLNLALALDDCANTLLKLGKYTDAETLFCESLTLARAIHQHSRDSSSARDLFVSLIYCADVCILRSSWVEAQAILDEAYELARVRQQLEESDSQADVDLAECCDRFALVAYARGRHRDAVQFHGRSASLYDLALKKSTHAAAFLPDVVASRLLAAATLLALRRKTDLQRLLGAAMINDGVAALQQQAADTRSRVLIAFWEFYMAMCESKKVVKAVRLKNAEAVLSLPGAWPLIQADVFLTRLNRDFCAYADAASGLPDSPRTATKSKSAKSRTGGKSRKSSR